MSARMVVDTSVIFRWFVGYGESGLDQAWDLLRRHRQGEITLIAPASALIELANVLRWVGIGEGDAAAFLADFEQTHVVLMADTCARTQLALIQSFKHDVSVYDATFLGLAREFDCPLVTADRRAFGGIPTNVADVRILL